MREEEGSKGGDNTMRFFFCLFVLHKEHYMTVGSYTISSSALSWYEETQNYITI